MGATHALGGGLVPCGTTPMTGFCRNGLCDTGPGDHGVPVVGAQVSEECLVLSGQQGNDPSTAVPESGFPGRTPGAQRCLCATR